MRSWRNIDDVVMGGVSRSQVTWQAPGQMVFAGEVSLENNGGFASIRGELPPEALTGSQGVYLDVLGDGKAYRLRLRSQGGQEYSTDFQTEAGQWQRIERPYSAFVAKFRGRQVPDAPPLHPPTIQYLGLLIAAKQAGPFRLVVEAFGRREG